MGGFGQGARPSGVKATLEGRQTWSSKARRFSACYEKRLRDGDPILSVDFFRKVFPDMSEKTFYNWRSKWPSFSSHLMWLEAQVGSEALVRDKYQSLSDVADRRRELVNKQYADRGDPGEIFLRTLEVEKSHERAMEESGVSWEDFRRIYAENEAWRERYILLAGPLPPDLPFFGLLAIDVLLRSALSEGKAADAKALLAKFHDRFRPVSQQNAPEAGKRGKAPSPKSMEALYTSMLSQQVEVN